MVSIKIAVLLLAFYLATVNCRTTLYGNTQGIGISHSRRLGNGNFNAKVQHNWNGGQTGSLGWSNDRWNVNVHATRDPYGRVSAGVGVGFTWRKRDVELGPIPTLPCNFSVYDTNSDEILSIDEFEAQLKIRNYIDRNTLFKVMDENSNELVTEEEFMAVAKAVANELIFPECYQGKKKSD